jgi:polyphosphate kinase 2
MKESYMETNNQTQFEIDGKMISLDKLIESYTESKVEKEIENKAVSKRKHEQTLKPYQAELIKLQKHIEETNQKMIILFEGRDAAGKGGTIRRITRYMNEKHYRIVALGKPTDEQRSQWYYQKYVSYFPRGGEIVLFDRSWYNRGMVESVFGFCTQKEHEDFMKGVKGFEKDLTRQGTILIKLYFSVTKDEQARRFERRKTDPLRQWKLSEIDLQAQDRWDDFTETKYNMLKRTHSHNAPWTVIRSNNKQDARFEALKVILNAIDYEGRDESLDYSFNPDVVISGAREIEIMDAQISRNGKFIG